MLSLFSKHKHNTAAAICNFTENNLIEVSNLSVKLGHKSIIENANFTLQRGQFTALLGPNGTGKSTLLKAMTDEVNYQGKVKVYGKERQLWEPAMLSRHLGVQPQSSSLSFNFTAQEVVELGGIGLSMTQLQLANVVERNMESCDVKHLATRYYPTLSGGERQRVHLARVLTQLEQSSANRILLLDEPTSALDLHHQHSTLALGQALARQGATVVAVLHDLNLAAQYTDRILILNQDTSW
ncbi:ABC-type hemin transport system ATPase component [Vibrio ponticus]|nr:ABC-type hemin transport system ATPase component [Vibrio ponticus]